MRRVTATSFAVAAVTTTACSLLVDTTDLSGGPTSDAGPDVTASGRVDGAPDIPVDSGDDRTGVDGAPPSVTTPSFDPGSTWPVSTSSTALSAVTPTFTTSAACTDLLVLANSGIGGGGTASATIATSTGMTFAEVVKDAGNSADTIYVWRSSGSCATRSGTVTVSWHLTGTTSIAWANVAVFAFTHSKGTGATANAHSPGTTTINSVSITPVASGSWLFASLSGNGEQNATSVGTAGEYVQEWSSEGAIQSYGVAQVPSATTLGVPVTFSMPTPDNIWANAAVELLSQ